MRAKPSSASAAETKNLPRLLPLLAGVTPLLLACWLYGYTLTLPYFLDDGPHFIILAQTDGLRHWGDFPIFPFYRPLAFSVWKLFAPLDYPAFILHGLNLFAFGIVAVLAGQITRQLTRSAVAGVVAGCFVVLFPFSYQAVAMVAALFHLLMALGVCLCLWSGLHYQQQEKWLFLVLCWLGAFMALFSHENGVLIAAFLPGGLWLAQRRINRRFWQMVMPVWGLTLCYIALWLAFSPNEEARTLSTEPLTALAALAQGLAYPLLPPLRLLFSEDAHALILLAGVGLTVGLAFVVVRPHLRLAFTYGLMWFLLALLPAVLILPAGYVLGQLRLALLASVGAGMCWGVVFVGLSRWPVLRLGLAVLAIAISVDFLHMRQTDFLRLAAWNRSAVAQVSGGHVALINAPMNLTPAQSNRRFLLGSEGVLWTDPTLDYRQQFWLQGIDDVTVQSFINPALVQVTHYGYTPHGQPLSPSLLRDADYILHTQFTPTGDFMPVVVGGQALDAPPESNIIYPQISATLNGADWWLDDARVVVRTRWTLDHATSVKLFAHAVCDGVLIAQNDGYIWGGNLPFAQWQAGATYTDQRMIILPHNTDPTCLTLLVGLYDENTGVRMTAQTSTGNPITDDAFAVPQR